MSNIEAQAITPKGLTMGIKVDCEERFQSPGKRNRGDMRGMHAAETKLDRRVAQARRLDRHEPLTDCL